MHGSLSVTWTVHMTLSKSINVFPMCIDPSKFGAFLMNIILVVHTQRTTRHEREKVPISMHLFFPFLP